MIDLEANPPRVIDKVVVGDAPEGFAISPTGKLAVAVLLRGSERRQERVLLPPQRQRSSLLKIDGKKVTRTNEVEVRGLPEGAVFSDDGSYLYVGNYHRQRHLDPARRRRPARRHRQALALPGQPASMRGRAR